MSDFEVFTWSEYSDFDSQLSGFDVLPLKPIVSPSFLDEVRAQPEALVYASLSFIRFSEAPYITWEELGAGESYSLRSQKDEVNFITGTFQSIEVSYQVDFPLTNSGETKPCRLSLACGQLFCVNRLGDLYIENKFEAPVYVVRIRSRFEILKKFGIKESIESLDLPIKEDVFFRLSYLSALKNYPLKNHSNNVLSAMGCYPSSLSSEVSLYVVDRLKVPEERERFLDQRTLAGLFPLPYRLIPPEEKAGAALQAQKEKRFPVFIPAGVYVFNLERFIYNIHRRLGESLRNPGGPQCLNVDEDRDFIEGCIDLFELKQSDPITYFSYEEAVEEKVSRCFAHIFSANFTSPPMGVLPFLPDCFVTVCSGLMPLALRLSVFKGAPRKTVFIDQNFRSVELWRDFVRIEDVEQLVGRIAISQRVPRDDVKRPLKTERVRSQIQAFVKQNSLSDPLDVLRALQSFGESQFFWDNFIERPESLSRCLRPGDRPFIWLSNSFYSTPSYHLYSLKDLDRRFDRLIRSIAEALQLKVWRPKVGFKAVFGESLAAPVGAVWDDMLDFGPEYFGRDRDERERLWINKPL